MTIQIDFAVTGLATPLSDPAQHVLVVIEKSMLDFSIDTSLQQIPYFQFLQQKLQRLGKAADTLIKAPIQAESHDAVMLSWVIVDAQASTFQTHTVLRKAIQPLLDEQAQDIAVILCGAAPVIECMSMAVLYVAEVNTLQCPDKKSVPEPKRTLQHIRLYSTSHSQSEWQIAMAKPALWTQAVAAGNRLCRELTLKAPNELDPMAYRQTVRNMAQQYGWTCQEHDMASLRKMGAGAFVAVAQGSAQEDAAIVHLTYHPTQASKSIALVGKGICFDTGGHNLKPAKYMHGMHQDMNGSAVALGTLVAATIAKLNVKLDVWLAIAQNHISPTAYKQNDIVTALNGTSIEIIHTDAEGRMVLADTLTLASRLKPDCMVDYATLTGSMVTALAERYSGVIANRPTLADLAVKLGAQVGERVCAFPFDEDYDEEIESKVADIKQCTLDGAADHIHAARFLSKFIEHDVPWLHIDLSCYSHEGGLGAVSSDVNGFGVALSMELLRQQMTE